MARFCGLVAFGTTVETVPGVWQDVIIERKYYGDVLRDTRRMDFTDKVNANIQSSNSFSILADPYAHENFMNIRYVKWMNSNWMVQTVEVKRPRLILHIGGIYNGETPGTTSSP